MLRGLVSRKSTLPPTVAVRVRVPSVRVVTTGKGMLMVSLRLSPRGTVRMWVPVKGFAPVV